MAGHAAPNIVEDGLIFLVDPANQRSYPGSGTSCTDLIENRIGTLQSTGMFDSKNNGAFHFDGASSDYISYTDRIYDVVDNGTIDSLTLNIWFNCEQDPNGLRELVSWWQSGGQTYSDGFLGFTTSRTIRFGDAWQNSYQFPDTSFVGKWVNITAVKDSTSNAYIYIDGQLKSSKGGGLSWGFNRECRIGGNQGSGEMWLGDIGPVLMYNKALSASEVKQNYNALKGRFGL
jgi:hypothetical protein